METPVIYWGDIGIAENDMETTIVDSWSVCRRDNNGARIVSAFRTPELDRQ